MTIEAKIATFSEAYFSDIIIAVDALMADATSVAKYGGGLMERPLSVQAKSLKNHLGRFEAGLEIDKDSGHRHIVAVVANALIMGQHALTKPSLDDRNKRQRTLAMGQEAAKPHGRKHPEFADVCAMAKSGGPVLETVED